MQALEIKRAMSLLSHGVYVLGVHTPEKDNLMTCAWLCQVSGNPPTVAAAVSAKHLTAQLIPQAGRFSVSILRQDQKDVALKNGMGSGRDHDRLSETPVDFSAAGNPLVRGAAAHLDCRLVNTVAAGDHVLMMGEVIAGAVFSEDPLRYREKEFF